MQDITSWYVVGDRPAAMSLPFIWGLILALYDRLGDGGRREGLGVEEVLLVGVFRQSFATWSVQQPFQNKILFFQADKRPLQLFGRGRRFFNLPLEVANTRLGCVEFFLQRGRLI